VHPDGDRNEHQRALEERLLRLARETYRRTLRRLHPEGGSAAAGVVCCEAGGGSLRIISEGAGDLSIVFERKTRFERLDLAADGRFAYCRLERATSRRPWRDRSDRSSPPPELCERLWELIAANMDRFSEPSHSGASEPHAAVRAS
jgi:hypothetical protein